MLGRMLGEVLREQEGQALFDQEERIRRLSIQRRRGPRAGRAQAAGLLAEALEGLPGEQIEPIIRAFTVYFRLVNLAEQHHRVRRARAHANTADAEPQRGSFEATFHALRRAGISAAQAREGVRRLEIILTLTAHPTEASRRTVLSKLHRLAGYLEQRDRCRQTPAEKERALAAVREEITALWQTDEIRHERPSVGDEVKNVAWYIEEILWNLLPEVTDQIARAFGRVYGEPLGPTPGPVRVHSWVGGDMDGNPRVTPDVLEDAILAYRVRGLRRLVRAAQQLGDALSQSSRHVTPPPALLASLDRDAERLPEVAATWNARTEGEPFRRKLRFVQARLEATLALGESRRAALHRRMETHGSEPPPSLAMPLGNATAYGSPEELSADLELVADTLALAGCARSGEHEVRALLARVRAFGFSIAELEARAPAEDARAAAGTLSSSTTVQMSSGAARLLGALDAIARAQRESGETACRTLILSMTQGPDDVLAALACARAMGLGAEGKADARGARIDIVPLFESYQALTGSADIVRALLDHPDYREHVRARGVQEVMIGYSDSSKEVGLLAATAALRRTQEALPAVASEAGITLRIFHGRGESVARGGGPAQEAILALPPGAVAGRYKATEQGEALDHKYARPELALRTLELVLGGALLHTLDAQPRAAPEDLKRYAAAFDEMADAGRLAYRALVWEDPQFEKFFSTATPLDAITRLNIGSRPSKRASGGMESLRAIPWVFAWTQNRAILPAWYGVGTGLASLGETRGGLALLREMAASWPFFRALLSGVEMVLAKSEISIFTRYAALAPEDARAAIAPRILEEHTRTRRWVKRILGVKKLLDGNPTLQRSIALRNPYVDPLSYLQVELLRSERTGNHPRDRELLLTLNGIAAGMRNTG
ncbi:Phosphoenolpyruvate carboxylase [Chondromyces apiculatus DSM 436]|uniref:Phosphoenolpyruvate carboxylase n=2 Tax=Chondromyces apiculatus TaxID=51 RepID=A0A017TBN1_9BACT|nr:Phosphoenolpyruvate carboxylase [Chondromyces apiculatus DSM 436]